MSNPRKQAAALLTRVLQDRDTLASLPVSASSDDAGEVALVREICLGTCRFYTQLACLLDVLLERPLKAKDADITVLMLIGLYQLFYMRIPDHAAINETVACVRKPWARGLVNAVLRNALRRYPDFPAGFSNELHFLTSHPKWLVSELVTDWSEKAAGILEANNLRAPLTLRVNMQKVQRQHYLAILEENGITATPGTLSETSVITGTAVNVTSLPGYKDGWFSVQDEASQLVPLLLRAKAGMRVLDACAAPGGKTAALLEMEPQLLVTAIDTEERRLERMWENLKRLGFESQVSLLIGDAGSHVVSESIGTFERILIDAPCSATGVIRRHPDIKILRKPEQVDELVIKQHALLSRLWHLLEPGGLMLYTTCSVLKRENSLQIASFLQQNADAAEVPLSLPAGEACDPGWQLFPGTAMQDGFYYALLQKC